MEYLEINFKKTLFQIQILTESYVGKQHYLHPGICIYNKKNNKCKNPTRSHNSFSERVTRQHDGYFLCMGYAPQILQLGGWDGTGRDVLTVRLYVFYV